MTTLGGKGAKARERYTFYKFWFKSRYGLLLCIDFLLLCDLAVAPFAFSYLLQWLCLLRYCALIGKQKPEHTSPI